MSDISAPPPVSAIPPAEDKTVAIVSYITLIGWLVALIIHSNKKTRLGAYHLRQFLGIMITFFAGGILMIIPIIGWIAGIVIYFFMLVCWVIGFIAAINGQMKPVPVVGEMYQKWFGNAFD